LFGQGGLDFGVVAVGGGAVLIDQVRLF